MNECEYFVDIHCHLLPGIDDGATSWAESLAMARIAVSDGIRTTVATPHQLGAFEHNRGATIRAQVAQLQTLLEQHDIRLKVLPGADVRIAPELRAGLKSGDVLTLGDTGVYVLLELPHEMYVPLEPVLDELEKNGMRGVLSHPERNRGLLRKPELVAPLVERGCAMQVTAGSLAGTFGPKCQEMSEWLFEQGLVHIIATDAHGPRARRPLMGRAYDHVAEIVNEDMAAQVCCANPLAVIEGRPIDLEIQRPRRRGLSKWLDWKRAS